MKSIYNALIFLWEKILDLLYPKQCIICGKFNEDFICNKCYKQFEKQPIIQEYSDKNFKEHMYIFKYENTIRNLILDYKFNDKAYIYEFFTKIILKNKKICRKLKSYDIIIPVPIHKKREQERGYNQSSLIAKKIAKEIENLIMIEDVLIKTKNNKKQSSLSMYERQENVKSVYKLQNKEKIYNKKIIIFDDIYTTGATANECAKVLKENGAKEILVFTIAKD